MTKPFVSVVVPVYNGATTLENCLKSVLNQDYPHYEVVAVDNHSTDQSAAVIKNIQKKDKRLRYVFEAHQTRGSARNAGIKKANGKIIAMTDSDCVVPNNWLTELVLPIIEDKENIVMGAEEDSARTAWSRQIQKEQEKHVQRFLKGNYSLILDTKNFASRAPILKQHLFDPSLGNCEDADFAVRMFNKFKIRYLPGLKVRHLHKPTLLHWIKLNAERGYWVNQFYHKYKKGNLKEFNRLFKSSYWPSYVFLPAWIIIQFIQKPFINACWLCMSEMAWKWGALKARLLPLRLRHEDI